MTKTMMVRVVQLLVLVFAVSQVAFSAPVRIRTKPLTMTGTYEPVPAPQADPNFNSVHIRTKPLTMTGTAQ